MMTVSQSFFHRTEDLDQSRRRRRHWCFAAGVPLHLAQAHADFTGQAGLPAPAVSFFAELVQFRGGQGCSPS